MKKMALAVLIGFMAINQAKAGEREFMVGPFGPGKFAISEGSRPKEQLGKFVLELEKEKERGAEFRSFKVWGYADFTGKDIDNDQLSKERALAVANYIRAHLGLNIPIVQIPCGESDLGRIVRVVYAIKYPESEPGIEEKTAPLGKETAEQTFLAASKEEITETGERIISATELNKLGEFALVAAALFLFLLVIAVLRKKGGEDKEKRINLVVGFQDGRRYSVKCPQGEDEMIICPICQNRGGSFISKDRHRVSRHLKEHFKKKEGMSIFNQAA